MQIVGERLPRVRRHDDPGPLLGAGVRDLPDLLDVVEGPAEAGAGEPRVAAGLVLRGLLEQDHAARAVVLRGDRGLVRRAPATDDHDVG